MRALLKRQTELSVASALFYCCGGVFTLTAAFVFNRGLGMVKAESVLIAASAFAIAVIFLVAGRRIRARVALAMMCLVATFVLVLAILSPVTTQRLNPALLFYTFMMYLVWFGPMLLARLFSYSWLAIYCIGMGLRLGEDVWSFLFTLVLTSVMLCELVGAYKNRLQAHSTTDPLCGVWNTRGFTAVVERESLVAQRNAGPLSLIYLDLDDLKRVNDSQGHAAGDRLLQGFAAEIERTTRPQDSLGRLGGDEFALLLPGNDAAQAVAAANRLRNELSILNWSFGVAQYRPGEQPAEFIARADARMLDDKRQRKAIGSGEGR